MVFDDVHAEVVADRDRLRAENDAAIKQLGGEHSCRCIASQIRLLQAENEKMRAENERLKKAMDAHSEAEIAGETHDCKVDAENERIRAVLEWYAQPSNYVSKGKLGSLLICSAILSDEGDRARKALEGKA